MIFRSFIALYASMHLSYVIIITSILTITLSLNASACAGRGEEASRGPARTRAAGTPTSRANMAAGKSPAATGSEVVPPQYGHCLHEAALDPDALEAGPQDGWPGGGSAC